MVNNCHDVSNLYKYFQQIDPDGAFFSLQKTLTYNKPLMFITSSRSIGKSTNIGIFCLLDYIKNGYKFIYCRRTKDEMQETCNDFFSNSIRLINEKTDIKIKDFKYHSGDYFIQLEGQEKPEHCGYAKGLSLEGKYKSKPFDNVGTILYDEFLPKYDTQYLGNVSTDPDREPVLMSSLYGSVDREIGNAFRSSTRIIFSGNTATIYNPFFIYYGITPYLYKDGKAKTINPKDKPWVLQRITGVDATKDFKNSILYAISSDSEREYNFNNNTNGADFNTEFISKPHGRYYHMIFLKLDNSIYEAVRGDSDFYIFKYTGQPNDRIITLDFSSFRANDFMLVKQWHTRPDLLLIHDAYNRGCLWFDSVQTKRAFTNYFQLI